MRLSETSRRRNSLESTFRTPHKNEDISEWDKKISGGFFPTEAIDELFTGKNSNIKESKFRRSLGPAVFVEDRKKKNPQFPRRSSEGFPTSRKVPNPMQKVSFDPVMKDKARSVELQRSIKSDLKFRNSLGPATVVREKKKKHPRRRSEGLQSLRKSLDPSRVSFDFASVNEKFGKIGEGSFLQNSNHRKSTDTRNSSSIIKKLELLSDPEKQFEKDSSDNRINLMALASLEDAYENASDDESMSTYSYAHAMETRGNSTRLKQSLFQNQNSDDDIQNSRTEKLNVTEYLNQMGKYKKR